MTRTGISVCVVLVATAATVSACGSPAVDVRVPAAVETVGVTEDGATAPEGGDTFAIGDTVEVDAWRYVVHDLRRLRPGQMFRPGRGQRLVGIDVTVTNTADEAVHFSPIRVFELHDSDEQKYIPEFGDGQPGGRKGMLRSGASSRGVVPFIVPKNASGLRLKIISDAGTFGSDEPAVIRLGGV